MPEWSLLQTQNVEFSCPQEFARYRLRSNIKRSLRTGQSLAVRLEPAARVVRDDYGGLAVGERHADASERDDVRMCWERCSKQGHEQRPQL